MSVTGTPYPSGTPGALTYLDLEDEVRHVWGESFDGRWLASLPRVVNEAGELLLAANAWRFLNRPPATLDLVADTNHVALPSDFGGGDLIDVVANRVVSHSVELGTLEDIIALRGIDPYTTNSYTVALEYPAQATTTAEPAQARLAIHPTPSSAVTGFATLTYRAGWVRIDGATDAAVPNVPPMLAGLLRRLVRAKALEINAGGAPAGTLETVGDVLAGDEMRAMVAADARSQINLGQMAGGAMAYADFEDRGGLGGATRTLPGWITDGGVS